MSELAPTGDWSEPAGQPEDCRAIPGYEILEELGGGGMGVVYKARQVGSNRLVALKLIRDGAMAGPHERARFRIETEAVARVRHPNVVQIYETGEHQGRLYFAMELVTGGSLASCLNGRQQLAATSAGLVRTLALAMHHAHTQHIVHRDLKPANVLLEGEDTRPLDTLNPKITDFGLAKRLDEETTSLTLDGAVLGTASYMSPEQAAGRVREIGPAADVYALGAILYELLTGRPPFQAPTMHETIRQVLGDEPEPPSRARTDVPRELEAICLKCLEKEPGRRYASAEELALDLGRYLEGGHVAATPLSDFERLVRVAARDGYTIVDEIGRGPHSTVYRALYRPLNQPVALKVFTAEICRPEEWESRVRDVVASRPNVSPDPSAPMTPAHPNIVPIHQAGYWNGAPYLAVEFVAHGCLASRLAAPQSRLNSRELLRLVDQVTEIVGYLHRQGIVHGNLKPSNILLAANGIPRIVDFRSTGGLFQAPLPADDAPATGIGYLAPELIDGHPLAEPRPYTDIYGLGIILYEALTGRPPFEGATVREMVEQIRCQDPVPPSRLNHHVTPRLEAICLHCLRKNPWHRYRRAYEFSKRLRSCWSER